MQKIGQLSEEGFSLEDLERAKKWFDERNLETELVCLNDFLPKGIEKKLGIKAEKAYILIIRNGVSAIVDPDSLFEEQDSLEFDTKALMRGSVKNKIARHCLTFADESQEANYEEGQGTIVGFDDVPIMNAMRKALPKIMGKTANKLYAESNKYYNLTNDRKGSYIALHGDKERAKVIGARLGKTFRFCYLWFHDWKPISDYIEFYFNHGDIYIPSAVAVGREWKKPSKITVRHAAGPKELTDWKPKKK
jgi:hypothetical protein